MSALETLWTRWLKDFAISMVDSFLSFTGKPRQVLVFRPAQLAVPFEPDFGEIMRAIRI